MKGQGKLLRKMIAVSCVYIFLMVAAMTGLLLYMDIPAERESQRNILREFAEKSCSQLDTLIQEMERITYSMATSTDIHDALSNANAYQGEENYFDLAQGEKRTILSLIHLLNGADLGGKSITLVSNEGDYINLSTYYAYGLDRAQMLDLSRMNLLEERKLGKRLTPVEQDPYGRTDLPMFSFLRTVADSYRIYGYVEVQDSEAVLDAIFSTSTDELAIRTVVLYEGEVFYASDHDLDGWAQNLELLQQGAQSGEVVKLDLQGESSLLYTTALKNHELTLYSLASLDRFNQTIVDKICVMVLLAVLVLLVMCTTTIVVNRRLYRPIQELRDRMNHQAFEDLQIGLQVRNQNDEIALFNQAFSKMLDNLAKQNDELMTRKLRDLELSYQVLRTQVSPHFLHNTLSVIGLNGELHGNPEVMEMCSCLSRMMSYCLDTQADMVPFSKEKEYMEYYLTLMQYRYLDRLQDQVDIAPALLELPVPKFILQPIVENCFTHGFRDSDQPLYMVRITGEKTAEGWRVTVEDNGVGFTPENRRRVLAAMEQVRRGIETSDAKFAGEIVGIGLVNTYARLLLGLRREGNITVCIGASDLGGSLVQMEFQRNLAAESEVLHADSRDRGGG